MNFIVATELKNRKRREEIERIMKNSGQNILSTINHNETRIIDIIDKFNPHGLIFDIANSTKIDETYDLIIALQTLNPTLKFFVLTETGLDEKNVKKYADEDGIDFKNANIFITYFEKMRNDGIITLRFSDFSENFLNIVKSPEDFDFCEKYINSWQKIQDKLSQNEQPANAKIKTHIDIPKLDNETLETPFQDTVIQKIYEKEDLPFSGENISIGVAELQHHIGCTHISFEIATFLHSQVKKVCVVMTDRKTYSSLSDYLKIPYGNEKNGFMIDNIQVFPPEKTEYAKANFEYAVVDFGFLNAENQRLFYEKTDVKIMPVSAADWDLSVVMGFLTHADAQIAKTINYFFYPISQSRFWSFNREFMKSKLKSYRICTSPDRTQPCKENRDIYAEILKIKVHETKNKKKFLFF